LEKDSIEIDSMYALFSLSILTKLWFCWGI